MAALFFFFSRGAAAPQFQFQVFTLNLINTFYSITPRPACVRVRLHMGPVVESSRDIKHAIFQCNPDMQYSLTTQSHIKAFNSSLNNTGLK